ncbi:PilZ domain-containing protein [Croceicoccus bisphenolivorans]|uniref:PilZ domain-containing protein n=1 Tax=Croceicoccus bisphenolivorans TaxID=1783232 RepID=UPI00155FD923|nr:PilZ domain-containing protein [Croceicoccus bisphenolivorans]
MDLRSDERQQSVYRPALIETDGFSGFCMVRNLSSRGMKADAYAELDTGQRVVVELSHIQRVDGQIIWSDGSNVGIRFDRKIDVPSVLLGTEGLPDSIANSRPPRLTIGCTASVSTERGEIPAWVSDVSQRGLKVVISGVAKGEEVHVLLPHHHVKKAIVRWTQEGAAGLNFVAPMKYCELAEWAIRVQEERLNRPVNPLIERLREARRSA